MLLPVTGPEEKAYRQTLTGIAAKHIRVHLLDRAGDSVAHLTGAFLDGSVTVDTTTDVCRSAQLQILDPRHRFGFDADTYQGGDLDLTRQVSVQWVVDSDLLAKPVPVPVMYGPITRLTRDGPVVTLEAQGPEVYGLTPAHRTITFKKGARKTDVLRAIVRDRMGITRLAIPDLRGRISAHVVIHPKDQPWKVAQKIAESMNMLLFFDGAGVCRLIPYPTKNSWVFRGGDQGGSLTSPLSTEADLTEVINRVKVTGRTPKGKKVPISYTATADPSEPLSAEKLGPPGAPMWLDEEIQNDHLRSERECKEVAERRLNHKLRLARGVTFNAAPVPHLEPYDVVGAETDFESISKALDTFTLPLGLSGDMQVGYTGPYRLHRTKKKRKHGVGVGHD